jgi:hypothetical protein
MADFSLTTLFVVPVGQLSLPSSGSTQDLTAGQVGFFRNDYSVATAGNIAAAPYFYVAQGRQNTYLQGSKRSDKIKGCPSGSGCSSNVTEWYKVSGCGTPAVQITDVGNWSVQCGEVVTLTLRGHSSYLDTLYFNGFTRSVTVQAPCCDCGADPCADVNTNALINQFIYQLNLAAPGNNPDNITLSDFYTFENVGGTILRIVANPVVVQRSSYPTGTAEEIAQLEKNFYSYQAGYLKHLYRMNGYNENFETYVSTGVIYDTYYIKFNQFDRSAYQWGDYIYEDSMVILAAPNAATPGNAGIATAVEAVLEAALGAVVDNNACITTTTTTTSTPPTTTTTTSTLIP